MPGVGDGEDHVTARLATIAQDERRELGAERARFGPHDDGAGAIVERVGGVRDEVHHDLAELRARHPGLAVYTNAYLRTEALRIFRQTFAITYALANVLLTLLGPLVVGLV